MFLTTILEILINTLLVLVTNPFLLLNKQFQHNVKRSLYLKLNHTHLIVQRTSSDCLNISFAPEPTAGSAIPGVSLGQGLLILLLGEFKVDDGDEIFSVRWSSLISILRWTIASSSFDWLTRLFCSFRNHDTALTVILNLHFENKNAVIWELKTHEQYTNLDRSK